MNDIVQSLPGNGHLSDTYQIIKKIGSGGGGTVYLAAHLRLGKKVVLKADRRKLSTPENLLRREVDVLKNLKHPYIPQVYDFFVENETAYTVMEYIEGESLNKLLKRGETFSQPQLVKWMVQLLGALDYLHSPVHGNPPRGYVHSDIKPANLMLRPNGDICLIDFNIALALGDEHAIGRSDGYASPEHYGLDFSSGSSTGISGGGLSSGSSVTDTDVTETLETKEENVRPLRRRKQDISPNYASRSSARRIVPDVRSDIYSVGATFYHLLSGMRPAKNAVDVVPLSRKEYSAPLVDILEKAMNPNPDLRWQTAAEMQEALLHLREKDPRMIHFRRARKWVFALTSVCAAVGAFAGYVGLRRMQLRENILKNVEYARSAQEDGDTLKALEYINQAFPQEKGLFFVSPLPQAQEVLTEILGVYDLSDGIYGAGVVTLPSEPLDMRMSPDGTTAAFVCEDSVAVADLETLQVTDTLARDPSVLAEVEYIDNDTIAFAGDGGLTVYDISQQKELWKGEPATTIAVSGDGSTIAAVYQEEQHAVVYDAGTGEKKQTIEFGETGLNVSSGNLFQKTRNSVFELNGDGSLLAASFDNEALTLFRTWKNSRTGALNLLPEGSGYGHYEGGFYQNYFAFSATRMDQTESAFVILDTDQEEQTAGISTTGDYYFTSTDAQGILLGQKNILVRVDPATGDTYPLINTSQAVAGYCRNSTYTLTTTDNTVYCFAANAAELGSVSKDVSCDFVAAGENRAVLEGRDAAEAWVLDYRSYPEAEVIEYDPEYVHALTARSSDASRIIMAGYSGFRIYDENGTILCDTELPEADNVYSERLERGEEEYFQVTYKDGQVRRYSMTDGQLLEEIAGSVPDSSLDQRFVTGSYRVEAPLREKPQVYDAESGKLIAELDEDANLINFYELDEYLVAQYMTADADVYGCLMDKDCQTLAYIPDFCDASGDGLLLDYPSGQIRSVQIYDLNQLLELLEGRLREAKGAE